MKRISLITILAVLPTVVFGAGLTQTRTLIDNAINIVNLLITLAAGLALLAFFWGLARFIFRSGGDEKAVEEGKRIMKWGIIAFFVMMSLLGIIFFIQSELGIDAYIPAGNEMRPENFRPDRGLRI